MSCTSAPVSLGYSAEPVIYQFDVIIKLYKEREYHTCLVPSEVEEM